MLVSFSLFPIHMGRRTRQLVEGIWAGVTHEVP